MSKTSNIFSLRELIDTAFGNYDRNTVNFNLIKTIIYILARQLRLLERQVEVGSNRSLLDVSVSNNSSNLSVTEVKIHAKIPDRRGKKLTEKLSGTASAMSGESEIKGDTKRETKRDTKGDTKKFGKTKSSRETEQNRKGSASESDDEDSDESAHAKEKVKKRDYSERVQKSGDSILKQLSERSQVGSYQKSRKKRSETKKSHEKPGETLGTTSKSKTEAKKSKANERKRSAEDEDETDEDEIAKIEKMLRIIKQRANSQEEGKEDPSPMRSPVSSEKILIVQTKSQEERDRRRRRSPKISVVTQEKFALLIREVNKLRRKYMEGSADIPETRELMNQLKKSTSLSDSITALQLSARLEAAEKALERLISLVTFLAQHVDKPNQEQPEQGEPEQGHSEQAERHEEEDEDEKLRRPTLTDATRSSIDAVTFEDLSIILEELKVNINKNVELTMSKNKESSESALKICKDLDEKISKAILVELRMGHLERMVEEYTQRINVLDTSLSSQMTHYQELLTQMEHDLEAGIENMVQTLANSTGDTTAISELGIHFNSLALDFGNMLTAQKDLRDNMQIFTIDIEQLWRQVEMLKEAKSDRDEVEDALRDKAGLDALNGLTTMMQFEAVRGDLEKRIGAAFEKFNSQEFLWQKAIDDFVRELNEKAHVIQLQSLRDEIEKYMNALRNDLEAIANIVGEPQAAATTRVIHRNTTCVSCALPAHIVEDASVPVLPAFKPQRKAVSPAIGAVADGAGDHEPCIPGKPIPRRVDESKAIICTRYCGGEHTKAKMPPPLSTLEQSINIFSIEKDVTIQLGSDGKPYKMDSIEEIPCLPCNYPEEQMKTPCPCGIVCKCYLDSQSEQKLD